MIDIAKLIPRLKRPGRTPVSGVPQGLDAMLLPLIAKEAGKRVTVHVALDDQRAAVLADQLAFFAPKLQSCASPPGTACPMTASRPWPISWPAGSPRCRASRSPVTQPIVLLTTVNAVLQRVVPRH
jgi:transcription-repair coupling factor (superfamily II helicase)